MKGSRLHHVPSAELASRGQLSNPGLASIERDKFSKIRGHVGYCTGPLIPLSLFHGWAKCIFGYNGGNDRTAMIRTAMANGDWVNTQIGPAGEVEA